MRIDPKLFRFPCGLLTALALALGSGPIHAAPAVKSRADTLAAMQEIMGPLPGADRRCPLDVRVDEEVDCGAFIRQRLSYQSEPGMRVPAYLLIPRRALADPPQATARAFPAMLTLHQTHKMGQKVVVGLGDSHDDEYGVELARRGYVCLAPPYPHLADYAPDLSRYASGTMKAIWDNIRGLDVLESLPYVRTNGFGAIGHSLGGHNSVFTAAFDERIRIVVSSCGLDSFRDYYDGDPRNWQPERGWCQTRYMPRLAQYQNRLDQIPFDFPDILSAIAPRTVFINAPLGDSNFRWRSVDRVAAMARVAFEHAGAADRLMVVHPDSKHRFPPEIREQAYRVLDQVLLPGR